MGETEDQRLNRIEQKLDKMAEALVVLARIEERSNTIFKRLDAIDERMNTTSQRVTDLERVSEVRGVSLGMADRVFWIIITAGVGIGAYWLRGS